MTAFRRPAHTGSIPCLIGLSSRVDQQIIEYTTRRFGDNHAVYKAGHVPVQQSVLGDLMPPGTTRSELWYNAHAFCGEIMRLGELA